MCRNQNQTQSDSPDRITLPFKDQKSAGVGWQTIATWRSWNEIYLQLQPVFTSKTIADHLTSESLKKSLAR